MLLKTKVLKRRKGRERREKERKREIERGRERRIMSFLEAGGWEGGHW